MSGLQRRGAALPVLHAAEDEDDDSRLETDRRTRLYGSRRPPAVALPPRDARARKDLQLLLCQQTGDAEVDAADASESQFEREQQDAKHRESAGWRPPLDRGVDRHGLRSTVPKDLRDGGNQRAHRPPDWSLGSGGSSAASGAVAKRSGVDGVFQPPAGAAQVYAQTRHRLALPSALLAYPPQSPAVAERSEEPQEAEETADSKLAWCPASFATLGRSRSGSVNRQSAAVDADAGGSPSRSQRFPLRPSTSTSKLKACNEAKPVDERRESRQRALLARAADACKLLRRRADRHKQPAARYALPVEHQAAHPRSYRLGLAPVPSTTSPSRAEAMAFRPKSAGCLSGFQPTSGRAEAVAKVAGAVRRPRSASITYLGRATVYCMAPESPAGGGGRGFGVELAEERRRRRRDKADVLQALATRGVFHGLVLAQVFARLRREALGSAASASRQRRPASGAASPSPSSPSPTSKAEMRRAAALEQLSMDEFMARCGLTLDTEALEEDEKKAASSSVEAARESLVVTRAQLLAALEPFHQLVSLRDANALFSAADVDVNDRARVSTLLQLVAGLQREHERQRRARVQL